jgi:hypothetical protein
MDRLSTVQKPQPITEGAGLRIVGWYDSDIFSECDMEVVMERIEDALVPVILAERKYLEAQIKGKVPPRKPRDCGCRGAGS